jgi:hypothetical protein
LSSKDSSTGSVSNELLKERWWSSTIRNVQSMKGVLVLRWFGEAVKVLLVRAKLLMSNSIRESV